MSDFAEVKLVLEHAVKHTAKMVLAASQAKLLLDLIDEYERARELLLEAKERLLIHEAESRYEAGDIELAAKISETLR